MACLVVAVAVAVAVVAYDAKVVVVEGRRRWAASPVLACRVEEVRRTALQGCKGCMPVEGMVLVELS